MNRCPACNGPQLYTVVGNTVILRCQKCNGTMSTRQDTVERIAEEKREYGRGYGFQTLYFAQDAS